MKKLFITFCVAFTMIVLFTSFAPFHFTGNTFYNSNNSSKIITDKIEVSGNKYIVVTSNTGAIAICKK